MRHSQSRSHRRGPETPAVLLIDLEDLYGTLSQRFGRTIKPENLIEGMLSELPALLQRQSGAQIQVARAFGDFSGNNGIPAGLSRTLYDVGIEPVQVSSESQKNAAEIQLVLDAADLLTDRPDARAFVLITGQRLYTPLLRRFKQQGRSIVVLALDPARERPSLLKRDGNYYLNLLDLAPDVRVRDEVAAVPAAPRNVAYLTVESEASIRTLEIIEEFFGQYSEIYLTPLLRKLSDELPEELDPKNMISDLEAAGAVYLEKRRGFPHDYTVLIMDPLHPDVDRVKQLFEDVDEDEDEDLPRVSGHEYDDDEAYDEHDEAVAPVGA